MIKREAKEREKGPIWPKAQRKPTGLVLEGNHRPTSCMLAIEDLKSSDVSRVMLTLSLLRVAD
jgi:hypothetical protein